MTDSQHSDKSGLKTAPTKTLIRTAFTEFQVSEMNPRKAVINPWEAKTKSLGVN